MKAAPAWFDFGAWLIDMDGTLYRSGPVRLAMAAELVFCAPHRIRHIMQFRKVHEALRCEQERETATGSNGTTPYRRQLDRAAESLGCCTDELATLMQEWMERRPGKWIRLFRRRSLLSEIAQFRARGGKTALISDYPARDKLARLGAESLFDVIIACGDDAGLLRLKPAPDGYLLAAERLGIAPRDCLVIGDRDDADGEAARRALMTFRLLPDRARA
jgi:HAD superfamily hydrolase (TIGR01549 family)